MKKQMQNQIKKTAGNRVKKQRKSPAKKGRQDKQNPLQNLHLNHLIRYFMKQEKTANYFSSFVKEDIRELYPPAHFEREMERYYMEKIKKVLYLFCAGAVFSLLLFFKERSDGFMLEGADGFYVERENIGGAEKEVVLEISDGENQAEISLPVGALEYTKEEFLEQCKELTKNLPAVILGENKSLDRVNQNLNLVESDQKSPISIAWSCDDYTYIDSEGNVNVHDLKKGEEKIAVLTATLTYKDYEMTESFPVLFVPAEETEKVQWKQQLLMFFQTAEREQKHEKQYILPMQFLGRALQFTEKKVYYSGYLLFLTIVSSIMIFLMSNQDLHKETKLRRQKLLADYPEFVSKLMLFMGAGMTTKAALYQIVAAKKVQDNIIERRWKKDGKEEDYLQNELRLMLHAMENGIYEQTAYETFGRRTKVSQYRKLMTVLSQNSKKGTKDILQILEAEAKETFELRKQYAKRLGEQAGTKLLLPMVMMLGIVMVLILVPAFVSYQV